MRIAAFGFGVLSVGAIYVLTLAAPISAQRTTIKDPVAHCRAVVNQDTPPGWDDAPEWMGKSAGINEKYYGLHWRCSGGQVLVCTVGDMHEVGCSQRDRRRQAEVPEYCRENPNASSIPYSAGNRRSVFEWRCRGSVPAIVRRYIPESQLDAKGFFVPEWKVMSAPTRSAPSSPALGFMASGHSAALQPYLQRNQNLRIAQTTDFPNWKAAKAQILANYSNRHPYYAVGDFNGDGRSDFAIVLVDRSVVKMPRNWQGNSSQYYNASVAVFNGTANGFSAYPNFIEKWGFVESSLLFYTHNSRTLMVGQWEGSAAQVQPLRNGRYRYYFGE